MVLRGKVEIEDNRILITELPYQVYVEPFIDKVKELIKNETINTIKEIYNKSDKKHLLIEIVCEDNPNAVLKVLYANTDLQKTFNPNQFALVGKVPKLLTLKEYFDIYIEHNLKCIEKECNYDLEKSSKRLEIVLGLLKALEDIDNIIQLIKKSSSSKDAVTNLVEKYEFTEKQAKAIVDMRLGKLANLEQIELNKEKEELTSNIAQLQKILESRTEMISVFTERLSSFTKKFSTERKTLLKQIDIKSEDKEIIDVVPEQCVVVLTEGGTIKRIPSKSFRTQKRNGKGIKTQEDITSMILRTNTVDSLMIFTDKGQMYRLLVDDIPEGTNASKGQLIKNLITLAPNEKPTVIYSIYRDTNAKYVLFVTKNGKIKKTSLDEYAKTKKKSGIKAINIAEDDELVTVSLIEDEPITLITNNGYFLTFDSKEIGASSRVTQGVKGINLGKDDYIVAALPRRDETDSLALFSRTGLGKKIAPSEIILQRKGNKGTYCYKPTGESGPIVAACYVSNNDRVLVVGNNSSICVTAEDIPTLGRISLGNIILKGNIVHSVSKV